MEDVPRFHSETKEAMVRVGNEEHSDGMIAIAVSVLSVELVERTSESVE